MSVPLGAVRFTAAQEAAIRSWFGPLRNRVAVSEVRHVLDLPAMNHHEFLGPSGWLAGGSVLRWVCGEHSDGRATKGDFDFYFPSLDALNATAQAMVERGFRVRGRTSKLRTPKLRFSEIPSGAKLRCATCRRDLRTHREFLPCLQ